VQVEHIERKSLSGDVGHDAGGTEQREVQTLAIIENLDPRCPVVWQAEQNVQWDTFLYSGGLACWLGYRWMLGHRR
jgi:hypothetical protein